MALRRPNAAGVVVSSPRAFSPHIDESLFKKSSKRYQRYGGTLSLTEVSPVITVKSYGLKEVLSYDQDFGMVEGTRRRKRELT